MGIFLFTLFLAILIGVGSLYYGKRLRITRELKRLAGKPISEFREGETGKVVGELEFYDESLIAPLSGRKCAYYQVFVEQRRSTDNSWTWRTVIHEEHAVDFVIAQGKDRMLVVANDYKGYLVKDRSYRSGFFTDATDHLKDYLKKFRLDSENLFGFNKTMRYREGILEAGETVAVKGVAGWETEDKELNRTKSGKYLVLRGGAEQMVISDDPETLG